MQVMITMNGSMIKNLEDYKEQKTTENQIKDYSEMIAKLNNCIDSLKNYSKYIPIMESISILHNSRTLFEIKLDITKRNLKNDK